MSGTISTGALTMAGIFHAFFDSSNTVFGTPVGGAVGAQTGVQTGSTFDTGSAFGNFVNPGTYSLTTVATLQMSGGATANYSNHASVTMPVPASGLGLLALLPVGFLARRKV